MHHPALLRLAAGASPGGSPPQTAAALHAEADAVRCSSLPDQALRVTAHPLLHCKWSGVTAPSSHQPNSGSFDLDVAVAAAAAGWSREGASAEPGSLRKEISLAKPAGLHGESSLDPKGDGSIAAVAAAAEGGPAAAQPCAETALAQTSEAASEAQHAPHAQQREGASSRLRSVSIPEPGMRPDQPPVSGELTATSLCPQGPMQAADAPPERCPPNALHSFLSFIPTQAELPAPDVDPACAQQQSTASARSPEAAADGDAHEVPDLAPPQSSSSSGAVPNAFAAGGEHSREAGVGRRGAGARAAVSGGVLRVPGVGSEHPGHGAWRCLGRTRGTIRCCAARAITLRLIVEYWV